MQTGDKKQSVQDWGKLCLNSGRGRASESGAAAITQKDLYEFS
jgi:hypothetical protein